MFSVNNLSIIPQDDLLALPFSFDSRFLALVHALFSELLRKRPILPLSVLVDSIIK